VEADSRRLAILIILASAYKVVTSSLDWGSLDPALALGFSMIED